VPDDLRATRTERKVLSRAVGRRYLPTNLDLRRKQGFSIPLKAWFRAGWADFFNVVLDGIDASLFDKRFIQKLMSRERMGFTCGPRLFALAMFELWRQEYKVSV
jgi:asparagine synthase (glutamine-hydrolysing)